MACFWSRFGGGRIGLPIVGANISWGYPRNALHGGPSWGSPLRSWLLSLLEGSLGDTWPRGSPGGLPSAAEFPPGNPLGDTLGYSRGIPPGDPPWIPCCIPHGDTTAPPPSRPRVVVVYRYWVLWDLVASLPLGDILIRNCPQMLLKCMPNATFGLRKIYQNSPFWLSPTAFDPGFEGGVFEKPGVLFLGPADEIGSDSGTHKGLIGSGASWSTRLRGSSEA